MSKKYKKIYHFFTFLSILLMTAPVTMYSIIALINGTGLQKVTMVTCLFIAFIFMLINLIFKHHIQCTIWVMLVGIYMGLDNIMSLIIIMCVTTALDEFIVEPLQKKYKNLYLINREIDKRG